MSTKKLQIIGSMNADTLDGMHASEFAVTSDVTALKKLVGYVAVSEQIDTAIASLPEGFSGSWNDLTDRPFGEGDDIEITWDGNTDSIETKVIVYEDILPSSPYMYDRMGFYYISDLTPTNDEIRQASTKYVVISGTSETGEIQSVDEFDFAISDAITQEYEEDYAYIEGDGVFVVIRKDNLVWNDLTFPKAGIYLMKKEEHTVHIYFDSYVSYISFPGSAKCLDEKYIPDTIARVSDVEGLIAAIPAPDVSEQINNALESSNFVSYESQTLTDEQQAQARVNIGFTEENAFAFAVEMDLIDPVTNENGAIFTDENNRMIII